MANAGYMSGPERRRQILDGAKRVFANRGYHQTNISHICDDLGIGRGTLYQYFKSKQDVFAAVVEDMLDRLREVVESRPPLVVPDGAEVRGEDILRFSTQRLRRVLAAVFEDEASLRILLREAIGVDLRIDEILRAVDDIVVDACARDLEAARKAGLLRADIDPRQAALLVVGGIEKLALHELGSGAPLDLDRMAGTASRLQLFGLLHPGVK
jgi:AcrR family transcriptional regulator